MPLQQRYQELLLGKALYVRINPRHELSDPARRYAYSLAVDMAKELLTPRGESTMALSLASLITRALNTTSDFPIKLGEIDRLLPEIEGFANYPDKLDINSEDLVALKTKQVTAQAELQRLTDEIKYARQALMPLMVTWKT